MTAFNFMGALLMMLHKQPPKPGDRDHKVAKAYGAPAPVTIFDAFQERFGVRLVEVYGSTELGTATGNTVARVQGRLLRRARAALRGRDPRRARQPRPARHRGRDLRPARRSPT